MDMPAGIVATLDRRAAAAGSRATTARVLDQHGRGEARPTRGPTDVVVFPKPAQEAHPAPDLCA